MLTEEAFIDLIKNEANLADAKITPDSTLEDLEIDSLDAVSIVFAIEDEYKVDIDPEELIGAESVGGLYRKIVQLGKEPAK